MPMHAGLMAHRARVLHGERTIRMHYANCATFNADFDGDEINLHLPQEQHGRAEGYHIVHADHQFKVPTDGKPVRGLIQDHVIAAVQLTKRDTFLEREEFLRLVSVACGGTERAAGLDAIGGGNGRVRMLREQPVPLPPPAMLKPRALWTGKQVCHALDYAMAARLVTWLRGIIARRLRLCCVHQRLRCGDNVQFLRPTAHFFRSSIHLWHSTRQACLPQHLLPRPR